MRGEERVKRRVERVRFETDRHVVVGNVTLPSEGYQSRFSDAVNREDIAFVPVVNAEVTPLGGGDVLRQDFIVLSKAHVRLAFPVPG